MKPFNLEAAMRGEPVVTRDGRKVKFIAYVPEAKENCRVVVFLEGGTSCQDVSEEGKYFTDSDSVRDLFMYEQLRADFEAWLPKAYRQPQESYSVHNMEVAFAAGYQAGRAALASPEVQALRDALDNLLKVHEGVGGTKFPADEIARAALAAMEKLK